MGMIDEALAWSGSSVTLSMFVVSARGLVLNLEALPLDPAPIRTRTYPMEDDEHALLGASIVEYDLVFAEVPPKLEILLPQCLRAAQTGGAEVAWFGFEGSFDFGCLLCEAIANQIYALIDSEGMALASDATLASKSWTARVVRAGARIGALRLRS